ncbi:MAG: hypothetical protein HRU09_04145 [Oligoflexales bacterium]|nr:hypothetical protein [Oligoflexales bacterium]
MRSILILLTSYALIFSPFSYSYAEQAQKQAIQAQNKNEITSKFRKRKGVKNYVKKVINNGPSYKMIPDKHYMQPQEAMSLEVDSALVGFMHGTSDGIATGLSSVASIFALGSCVLGLINIFNSAKDSRNAEIYLAETEMRIEAIDSALMQFAGPENRLKRKELHQTRKFFADLRDKIKSYLEKEKRSMQINTFISTGTFAEFIGFVGGSHMLGHESLFPSLAPVAHYFLAGGLLVVSVTSLLEAGKEIKKMSEISSFNIPGLDREMLVVPDVVHGLFLQHERGFSKEFQSKVNENLGLDEGLKLSSENFSKFLTSEYEKAIKKRMSQRTWNSGLKVTSRVLVGTGTGLLAAHEFAAIAGVVLLPSLGLTLTGVGTGIGVAIGVIGFIYYLKYIKSAPPVDAEGLDTSHIDTMRMEILSILLKLNLDPPNEDAEFEEMYRFFVKLSPIGDISHTESTPDQIPFVGQYESEQDKVLVAAQILNRLYSKGQLNQTAQPILTKIFNYHLPEIFSDWEPYVSWDFSRKEGTFHWSKILEDCLNKKEPRAMIIFDEFVRNGIKTEYQILQDELKLTIDQFVKILRKQKKGKLEPAKALVNHSLITSSCRALA